MTPEQAKVVLEIMSRSTIRVDEIPAVSHAMLALNAVKEGDVVFVLTEEHTKQIVLHHDMQDEINGYREQRDRSGLQRPEHSGIEIPSSSD